MDTRVAIIGIIVEDMNSVKQLNEQLHEFAPYIIGRMGLPYEKKNVSIISIAVDAPQDTINAMSGKIGSIPGVTAKATYSKI